MRSPTPGRRLRHAAALATLALACGLFRAPLHAQQTGSPAMQQAVDALTRALKEKSFDAVAPYLDDSFHIDQLTGAFARQILQQAVAGAHHVPTAVHVEQVAREGNLVRATTRFEYADTTRTLALVLTEAGKFVEIPLVQVHMSGGAGGPPPGAVGGLQMRVGGATPPSSSDARPQAGPPPAAGTTPAPAPTVSNPVLRDELLQMRGSDQELRNRISQNAAAAGGRITIDPETRRQMAHADSQNVARLKEIVAQHGWPGVSMVGQDGSQAAFLVLQHADQATQEEYLPLVREAATHHEIATALVAMLEDRVRMRRGEKQLYGSQLKSDPATGKLELWPVEDEAHVDQRRAAVGLPPLAQYLAAFGLQYTPPAP
jgi:hypothetical protein